MRSRGLLLMLILVLPLRLWAGALMPVLQSAAAPAAPSAAVHAVAPCHGHAEHAGVDAPVQASAQPGAATPESHPAPAACDPCPLCHGGALPGIAAPAVANGLRHAQVATVPLRTASAEPRPTLKPPIS